ncbi:MAG: hypothetical protein Q4E42_04130 [Phascolarctobacterium sp.]|nr:hypothetical protein [Phascolarctobacterium sp.]
MKKNKTKPLLACAVLASVLGIGNMVQAATTDTAVRGGQTFYFGNFWQSWDEEKTGESWPFQNDSVTPNQLILDAKNSKDPEKWAKAGDINNYKKEPIKWVVLGNNDGALTAISYNGLYGDHFDSHVGAKTSQIWGASDIRKTLNGGKNMSGMGTDTNGDGTLENVGFAGDAFTNAEWALLADHKTYFESHIPHGNVVIPGHAPEPDDPSWYITSPTDPLLSDVGYIKDETAVERQWNDGAHYINISNYYVNDKVYILSIEDVMNPTIQGYLKDKDFYIGRRGFTDFTTCVGIYGYPTGGAYVGEGVIPDTDPPQWCYTGPIYWGHSRSPGDTDGSTYSTLYANIQGINAVTFHTTDASLPGGMAVRPVVDLNLKNLIFTTAADKWNATTLTRFVANSQQRRATV